MDSFFRKPVTFTADKGIWSDDPMGRVRVPNGFVPSAPEFLFWNQAAVTRPGFNSVTINEAGTFLFLKAFQGGALPLPNTTGPTFLTTIVLCLNNSYYFLGYNPGAGTYIPTAVTGPAFTSTSLLDSCLDFSNLELIVGGSKATGATGLHRVTLGGTYTEVVGEPWYYVLGHRSRLLVANKQGAGNGAWMFGWTVPGTTYDFTSFGGGNVTLVDAFDIITGLLTIRDFVVIARGGGFTVAYPTGQADPPFEFKNVMKSAHLGVKWPSTLVGDGMSCFFLGEDDVYSFDLSEVKSIGGQVKKTVLDAALAGTLYRGTVIRSTGRDRRRYYILSPLNGTAADPTFWYDIVAGTWATIYTQWAMRGGIFDLQDGSSGAVPYGSMPAFVDSSKILHVMQKNLNLERASSITFGPYRVESIRKDYRVLSSYLSVFVEGVGGTITLRVQARKAYTNLLVDADYSVESLAQSANDLPQRLFFRIDEVGNFFTFTFTFPLGNTVRFESFECEFAEAGELR